jgi:hypothetical protein
MRKLKNLCMVQLVKNFLFNKLIDSHLWFIFLHNTTSCTTSLWLFLVFRLSHPLFRLHFHRKSKTSKLLLVMHFHFEFLTTFGILDTKVRKANFSKVDACADTFSRCSWHHDRKAKFSEVDACADTFSRCSWHHVRKANFSEIDACAEVFPRCGGTLFSTL